MNKRENVKTVILGVGNILLGDEGIGVRVIKELEKKDLPSHVKVIDGATAGFSLLPIFETYKDSKFIIIDAIKISSDSSSNTFKNRAVQKSGTHKDKLLGSPKSESTEKSSPLKDDKKNNDKSTKGSIYIIPLNELYEISKSDYPGLEFISFHQTGLMDVLNLLYMTSKIKISGYLIGVNIFDDENSEDNIFTFSMKLSQEIEQKIPEIIEILKRYI